MKKRFYAISTILMILICSVIPADASSIKEIEAGLGKNDALLLLSSDGNTLASKNSDTPLVPASTLKILTSLCAFHYLGEDYRFPVKFYLRENRDLVIEGFGDPLLVSEVIDKYCTDISGILTGKKIKNIRNIITDDSFFDPDISIPGAIRDSSQPYDAPAGALGVNFNSISFKTVSGKIVSSEPQTPLTGTAIKIAVKSGLKAGRIPVDNDRNIINTHSGETFRYFLQKSGIKVSGIVISGKKQQQDIQVYTAYSPYTMKDAVSRLLEFSSNFMANQIFLSVAAKYSGKPANLSLGVKAVKDYAQSKLGMENLAISEGSGLSRQNRISAEQMSKVLEAFYPYHTLMKNKNGMYYKTGTLDGVSARAGYMESESGDMLKFVIFVNSSGRNAESVLDLLKLSVQ